MRELPHGEVFWFAQFGISSVFPYIRNSGVSSKFSSRKSAFSRDGCVWQVMRLKSTTSRDVDGFSLRHHEFCRLAKNEIMREQKKRNKERKLSSSLRIAFLLVDSLPSSLVTVVSGVKPKPLRNCTQLQVQKLHERHSAFFTFSGLESWKVRCRKSLLFLVKESDSNGVFFSICK